MFLRAVPSALSNVVQSSRRFFSRLRAVEEYVILESESKEKFKINCLHTGSGPNALILLPGALGTIHTDFQPQLDALPTLLDNYTIIAWDPPGYGKSRPPERTFPPGFYHRDAYLADALMRRLGFDKYSVAGWSDGGSTGLVMASSYPEVIQKLIIWGAGSYVCPTELEFCESIRDVSKWSPKMREPAEKVYGDDFPRLWSDFVDGFKDAFGADGGRLSEEDLERIEARTLILHGVKDQLVSKDHPPLLRKLIKFNDYHEFPEGKHNIHLRYADEFNKILSEFLLREI